jgi:hypothetical protein
MGTAKLLALVDTQVINSRAILGGFVCIFIIIAFYNLFKGFGKIRAAAYLTIIGVIIICSLILFSSAIYNLVNASEAIL